ANAAAAATRSAGIGGSTMAASRTAEAARTASRVSAAGEVDGLPRPERTLRSCASNSAHGSSLAGEGAMVSNTRRTGMENGNRAANEGLVYPARHPSLQRLPDHERPLPAIAFEQRTRLCDGVALARTHAHQEIAAGKGKRRAVR